MTKDSFMAAASDGTLLGSHVALPSVSPGKEFSKKNLIY